MPVESTSQTVRTKGHSTNTGVPYSTAAETGRKKRRTWVSTRFAPGTEDGRGGAGGGGAAEPTSRDQNKRQERDREKRQIQEVTKMREFMARKRRQ